MVKNPSAMQETQVQSLGQEDPLEKESLPPSIFLPENSVDRVLELSNSLPGSQPVSNQMQFIFTAVSLGIPVLFFPKPLLEDLTSPAPLTAQFGFPLQPHLLFPHLPPCCLFTFPGPCICCLLPFTIVIREGKNDYSFKHILGKNHF